MLSHAEWRCVFCAESPSRLVSLPALAAPEGEAAGHMHKTEDLCLRRLWRLTNTLAKGREGGLKKKIFTDEATKLLKTKDRRTN